jgi:hypothetical protein
VGVLLKVGAFFRDQMIGQKRFSFLVGCASEFIVA